MIAIIDTHILSYFDNCPDSLLCLGPLDNIFKYYYYGYLPSPFSLQSISFINYLRLKTLNNTKCYI